MGVRISVFAPQLCSTPVSGLDEYADGCLFKKRADWYPFCPGGGTRRGVRGGGQGGPAQKSHVPIQNFLFCRLLGVKLGNLSCIRSCTVCMNNFWSTLSLFRVGRHTCTIFCREDSGMCSLIYLL